MLLRQGGSKMLVKLLPEQISKFWDVIKYAIEQSVPPIAGEHPNKMNNILMAALEGSIDIWASYRKDKNVNKFEAIVVTEILYDVPTRTRNLLIYCVYGYSDIGEKSWIDGVRAIAKYAASKRCNRMVAYTEVPYIVDLVSRLGADTRYTFISFYVKDVLKKLDEFNGEQR